MFFAQDNFFYIFFTIIKQNMSTVCIMNNENSWNRYNILLKITFLLFFYLILNNRNTNINSLHNEWMNNIKLHNGLTRDRYENRTR